MRIGILGTGHIGKSLVQKLSAAGHDVKVANSRGPETIDTSLLSSGAHAVTAQEAVVDVDVVILSIPLKALAGIAPTLEKVPEDVVVIDTSNYYPFRDGRIEALDSGQIESHWVSEQIGRHVAKAWNAIGSGSLADNVVLHLTVRFRISSFNKIARHLI
ncbi:NAD(P)-binding domain-containing protein [Agrobacterium larrymoorei]|uniref:NADPH-dependent F420 reductase n=1 Tax=Agrobacterium larrymoorei TaxID=160699 RepID=UPI0015721659|nr:NAD(P)-binding domain-containing protein [Agrobacterium larrymoorei]NTJ44654.1 NAD(P)-binding domain-containing protein [Agrobacterium larrymoorei]